jgi:hypothetical protein
MRGVLVTLAAYWAARLLFGAMTEDDGLISPTGDVRLVVAVLGVLVLLLRLGVVFVVPAVVTYRLVARLLERG